MGTGGFKKKEWVMSKGIEAPMPLFADNEGRSKVLGVVWDSRNDTLRFEIKLNFSPKVRNVRLKPDITKAELPRALPLKLTLRTIISQVNGFFDPIGLATVKAKIQLRKLAKLKLGWDEPIPDDDHCEWLMFFNELFEMNNLVLPRAIKSDDAVDDPVVVYFGDAYENAFGANVYARWETQSGEFVCRLFASKSRLAPLKQLSMPRLELNGALLIARLKCFIDDEMRIQFTREYHIVD